MAYIGNSPANVGNYQIVDDISSSFDGNETSFALASGSITITPAKSGQLLVGINGVMQEPDDTGTNGFKVSGSNVVFSSAPASGDTFWSVYQGQNVDIGTPSDDVVDTVHIKDNAITAAKIAAGTIVASDIASNSITNAKMADDSVDSAEIVDGAIDTAHIGANQVTAAKVAADVATQAELDTVSTVASAALPKAGGAMTGAITTNSTFDGVDIAVRDAILTSTTTTAGAALPKAGGTMTGSTIHNDSVKSIFGTSSDGLEIFHDGHSRIKDTGTGNLYISGSSQVNVQDAAGEPMINCISDGAVQLAYHGDYKIATTNTGIDVTGNVVADGADLNGAVTINDTGADVDFRIESDNLTHALFVQGSDGAVGIGVTPPTDIISGYSTLSLGGNTTIHTNTTAGTGDSLYINQNAYRDTDPNWRRITDSALASQYRQNAGTHIFNYVASGSGDITWSEAMRIDATGKVGIGTDSPLTNTHIRLTEVSGGSLSGTTQLVVENATGAHIQLMTDNDRAGGLTFGDPEDNDIGGINYMHDANAMAFTVNAAERMRITSGGNVGIGDTDPSEAKLSITGVAAGDIGLQIVQAQDEYGLYIDQNGNGIALYIDSESGGNYTIESHGKYPLNCVQDISGGRGAIFSRNIAEAGSMPLVTITDDHTSNTQPALQVQQDGAGRGIFIDQNGNKEALYIDSESTSYTVMQVEADTLTSGSAAYFYSNSANTAARNLFQIINDNAAATGTTVLYIKQDSTGNALDIRGSGGDLRQRNHGGTMTLADDAVYTMAIVNTGALVCVGSLKHTGGGGTAPTALFFLSYADSNAVLLADSSSTFASDDTDGKMCCYSHYGGNVYVKNRLGFSNTVSICSTSYTGL